jgi:hypothetical protein
MSTTRAMKVTNDVKEIRRWVESKGGRPAHVRGSGRGEDPGVLRIDFPGTVSLGSLERMSWADWAKWFDKKQLALVFQPSTRFSRIVPAGEVSLSSTSATAVRAAGAKRATSGRRKKQTAKRAGSVGRGNAMQAKRVTKRSTATKKTHRAAKRTAARRPTKRG